MLARYCQHILLSGENSGKQCKRKPQKGLYCYQHKKYYENNGEYDTPEEINKIYEQKRKLEYYKNQSIHKRLYGQTIEKVNDNYTKPCLQFIGVIDSGGYGRIYVFEKQVFAHVLSYALAHNIFIEDIPKKNEDGELLEVCHGIGCNKSCVEPTHLSLKTKSMNNYEDKLRDGKLQRGAKQYHSKITEDQAKQIKNSKNTGSQLDRANKFGVSGCIVADIDSGKSWAHIPDKNGDVVDTSETRRKIRERRKNHHMVEFTQNDWNEALKRLRERSIDFEKNDPKIHTPCHLFQGLLDKDGYGRLTFKGLRYFAHVLACEAKQSKKRGDKTQIVRHLCDIPQCCNPDHLEFGTYRQNAIDAINNNKNCKLNVNKVTEIKSLLKLDKMTHEEIAQLYHVSRVTISNINTGRRWSHVKT
jgi:DNA-binding XRE family transcriptional regulator